MKTWNDNVFDGAAKYVFYVASVPKTLAMFSTYSKQLVSLFWKASVSVSNAKLTGLDNLTWLCPSMAPVLGGYPMLLVISYPFTEPYSWYFNLLLLLVIP